MTESFHDYEADKLKIYDNWSVYLHENQSYLGRSYIALNRDGEVDPFMQTTPEERSELLLVVSGLKAALDKLYQPNRLNYANLRNTWLHCHWHVIPRYQAERVIAGHQFDDPNWGGNYAPAHERQIPEEVYEVIYTDMATELNAG